jgi:hypothetical protein
VGDEDVDVLSSGPQSPTRSPSPLAFNQPAAMYHAGSSNLPQQTIPSQLNTSTSSSPTNLSRKSSFNRPKSCEPSSPLLRRALSPDRLHARGLGLLVGDWGPGDGDGVLARGDKGIL